MTCPRSEKPATDQTQVPSAAEKKTLRLQTSRGGFAGGTRALILFVL
jgi:hypothetical protein